MSNPRDVECMSYALRLAKQGIYSTRPNPNVGCVITNTKGEIMGEGYHHRAGGPHAEIFALQQAGDKAKGGIAYISLEPCCHYGKTGPCVEALIDAGIQKVFIAMRDPNPLVSGKGVELLKQHNIEVEENILSQQANCLNRGFIKRMSHGLPWVTAKVASSSDGRTALSNGASKWITSELARFDVQKIRARHDAIMTGIGTVLADDPSLNMRLTKAELGCEEEPIQPIRIVLDPELEMSTNAKMLSLTGKTIIYTAKDSNINAFANLPSCEVIQIDGQNNKFDLHEIFKHLAKLDINSVLVESGASLLGQLINAQLIDELIHYIAPTLMGNQSRGMFDVDEIANMNECISLEYEDIRQIGKDIRITSLINY